MAVSELARFANNPGKEHWQGLKRIFAIFKRYYNGLWDRLWEVSLEIIWMPIIVVVQLQGWRNSYDEWWPS